MLGNINQHVVYMTSNVSYILDHINADTEILKSPKVSLYLLYTSTKIFLHERNNILTSYSPAVLTHYLIAVTRNISSRFSNKCRIKVSYHNPLCYLSLNSEASTLEFQENLEEIQSVQISVMFRLDSHLQNI